MLWGNVDAASGNQKPVFANTTNNTASSTTHGSTANSLGNYGAMMGISATELQRNALLANTSVHRPSHAGWVSAKVGAGPIASIRVTAAGDGYPASNSLTITDQSNRGSGAVATYSVNTVSNTITSVTISNGGAGYVNADSIVITAVGPGGNATFQAVLGGRAGRVQYETIIAMGSISGDDPKDDVYFGGI